MKPSKANLETLIDIVALLIKQGQMGRVNRDQPGESPPPGIGVGKPRGMPPPTSPDGRKWRDHPQTKLESTPAPTPEPKPEPVKRVRTTNMYGKTVYPRPGDVNHPATITPEGFHPSGREKRPLIDPATGRRYQ